MKFVTSSEDRIKIKELGDELGKLIEDFDRAVGVEVLRKTSERDMRLFSTAYA